ncbi:hypothetical protein ABK040_008881 [Willaertia magna]
MIQDKVGGTSSSEEIIHLSESEEKPTITLNKQETINNNAIYNLSKKPVKSILKKKTTPNKQKKKEEEQEETKPKKLSTSQQSILLYQKLIDEAIQRIIFSMVDQPSVSELYLDFTSQLLQPKHLEEIMEERNASQYCANPLCSNEIDQEKISSKAKYFVDFNRKKILDVSNITKRVFCCNECKRISFFKMKACPTTLPYTRTNCIKLLSMLFPKVGEEKIKKLINSVKENAMNDKEAILSIKVKENVTPKKPLIGAKDALLNCDTNAIEGFVPKEEVLINNQKLLEKDIKKEIEENEKQKKRIGYFFDEEGNTSNEENEENDNNNEIIEKEFTLFHVLSTLFSRWTTRKTIEYFHSFDKMNNNVDNINDNEKNELSGALKSNDDKSLDGLSHEEMEIYQKLYANIGIDISEDVKQVKPKAKFEYYSKDSGEIKDEIELERLGFLKDNLFQNVNHFCKILGYDNPSKLREQIDEILSTFNFECVIPAFQENHWNILTLLLMKALSIKDIDFKEDIKDLSVNQFPKDDVNNMIMPVE